MAGGSSSSSSSTPQDMTPAAFQGLQGPYASVLGQLLGFQIQGPNGQPINPVSFGYPAGQFPLGANGQPGVPGSAGGGARPTGTQQTSAGQTPLWGGANQQNREGGSSGAYNYGQQSGGNGGSGGAANPYAGYTLTNPNLGTGNPNDILNGIPTYQGPLSASLGANEQTILDQLMQRQGGSQGSTNPNDPLGSATSFLNNTLNGKYVPGNSTPQSLAQFAQGYQGAHATAAYDPNSENPFLQAAIQAAQRPTLQGLTETLSRTLPGRFTQAGQFNQPQGSSAFDRAAALATRGSEQSMADIATNLSSSNMEAQLQRNFQAQQSARGAEDTAMQGELTRTNQNNQNAQDRQIQAAQIAPGVSQTQMSNMVQNLQAQALPRLIQEYGIERGMQEFNNRTNTLLSVLGIAGGTTQPTISQKSESSSSTKPNLLPLLGK